MEAFPAQFILYGERALPNGRDWNGELEFLKRLKVFPFMFEEESRGERFEGGKDKLGELV